jgi:hypothetical protein
LDINLLASKYSAMTFHFRIFRRSLYEQIDSIDTRFTCAMDYDLSPKLSEVTQVYPLPHLLYFYRDHPDSISQARRLEQIGRVLDVLLGA